MIPLTSFFYNRRRKLYAYYQTIWKKSSRTKPDEILGIRGKLGFDPQYYKRPMDEHIKKKIENNQSVLILGGPLSGKSRAVWQALTTLRRSTDVIIPRVASTNPDDFSIPFRFTFWRKSVLLLDNIDEYAEKLNFMYMLHEFLKHNCIVVATCRSGNEFDRLKNKMGEELPSLFEDPIEIPKISEEEAKKIADSAKKKLPTTFDGNIGSVFMPLNVMKERFQQCSRIEKSVLSSINRLHSAGIDAEKLGRFPLKKIEQICKSKYEVVLEQHELVEALKELQKKGFVEVVGDEVRIETAYFEGVIESDFDTKENLRTMIELFREDFRSLALVGMRAYVLGDLVVKTFLLLIERESSIEKLSSMHQNLNNVFSYHRLAIQAFEEALKIWPAQQLDSWQYLLFVQYNVGLAHAILAINDPENKIKHYKEATKAYDEVLRISRLHGIPENQILEFGLSFGKSELYNLKECLDDLGKDQTKAKNETERKTYIS
jgi:tetratricopeptide (TPR) repeat protein